MSIKGAGRQTGLFLHLERAFCCNAQKTWQSDPVAVLTNAKQVGAPHEAARRTGQREGNHLWPPAPDLTDLQSVFRFLLTQGRAF